MRIIFLNRFYWPDEPATAQLLTDLAEALAARGHPVTVIASQPAEKSPGEEIRAGVQIVRVGGTHWGRHRLAGRAVDFATFLAGACWRLFWRARRGDLVVAMTDPPLLGLPICLVARIRGARCLHWVQDIFPEVALALTTNAGGRAVLRAFLPFRNLAWRQSEGCVAPGEDMAAFIAKTGVEQEKIAVIPNWAPAGLDFPVAAQTRALRESWGVQEKFVVLYSGNLGRVHDFEPVLEAAILLQKEAGIAFVFVGGGARRAEVMQAAQARALPNLHFFPPQPRSQLPATLAAGDVHLVTVRPGCENLVFPSKLYGIAAVARPVLFVGPKDSEVARLVTQGGFGMACTRDQPAQLARLVQELAASPARCAQLGSRAREFSQARGCVAHALSAWESRFIGKPLAQALPAPTLPES